MQGILKSGMQAEVVGRPANPKQKDDRPAQGRSERQGGNPRQRPSQDQRQPAPKSGNLNRDGALGQRSPQSDPVNMDPEVTGEQRNALVNGMLGQLYGPQLDRAATILEQSAPEPMEGVGRVVSGLLGSTYKRLKDDGKSVPPGVMFQAGMMAAQAVGEMGMRMGILDESTEADAVESGFMMAMGNFGRANRDAMSADERQRYGQLIDGMEEGKRMAMAGDYNAGGNREKMMQGGA